MIFLCGYDIRFDAFHDGGILSTAVVVQLCGLRYYIHTIGWARRRCGVWGRRNTVDGIRGEDAVVRVGEWAIFSIYEIIGG